MVRSSLQSFFIFICASLMVSSAFANRSNDKIWQTVDESSIRRSEAERTVVPTRYKVFRADKTALRSTLEKAPPESVGAAAESGSLMTLPLPDGGFSSFRIQYSPIMEEGLAARYPEIRTYIAQSVDDPSVTARISMSPTGFRAIIFSNEKTVLVDPYAQNDTSNYIAYEKAAVAEKGEFHCLVGGETLNFGIERKKYLDFLAPSLVSNGSQLRAYRLALAATAEYTNFFRQISDTDAQAKARVLEQQAIIMTRVNGIYERDLSIRMILVNSNDSIIFTDREADPYTNGDGIKMLDQNQMVLDREILPPNYEIGHVFSTGGGGLADLNVSCSDARKARGVSGIINPTGDPFAVDYVAHELGHQWGAGHTFNGGMGNCTAGNRFSSSAFEPGSGVTVMGYAGICSAQDLARNSIDTFHVKSIEEILSYVNNGGGGCSVNVATGNAIPAITSVGGNSFNIPKDTPFALTASANDPNGDSITYDWQQYDLGEGTISTPNTDSDGNARPLFRPYSPTANGTRFFPSLQYILNNANVPPASYDCGRFTPCLTGELLPSIARKMKFQAVARDNRAGAGAVSSTMVEVNVDGNSGPFQVTTPNTALTWQANSSQTVTWNVANTNNAPVGTANVRILLSTNGGQTFPTVLAESTPNDGSQTVHVPNVITNQARIKIEAVGNIFFDISNTNFTISLTAVTPARRLFDFDGDGKADVSVFRPSAGAWYLLRSQAGFSAVNFGISTDKTVAADYDNDGKTDVAVFRNGNWYWLNSSNGAFNAVQFGQAGDAPITGDFDGDGKNDPTVFRGGVWYILQTSNNQVRINQFGLSNDKPLTGDFDGDGKADLAVYRGGNWYIRGSTQGFIAINFGISTDQPVPADYDGDGKTDAAVYRGGNWYLLGSQAGFSAVQFGIATDIPSSADFDGDGKSDISVFRNGVWYLLRSQSGFTGVQFGVTEDKPITAQLN